MATDAPITHTGDAGILARLIRADDTSLPPGAAKALLRIRFTEDDLARIHELAAKNQDDALTDAEKADLESYLRVSPFLDLMHAKARRSLKKRH